MEAEERQALSIDSQVKEMRSIATRNKLRVVAVKKEAHLSTTHFPNKCQFHILVLLRETESL